MENKTRLIVIVGPTAVGKTEISIQLAEYFDGEIISADSRLFYRGMDIGTAKPDKRDRERVPHYLIDVAEPNGMWSLAMFQREAYDVIDNILARGKIPFLVGGTGQYITAVVKGWEIPEVKPNPYLRKALENWAIEIGTLALYERLSIIDSKAAVRMDPQNLRRIIRALEVIFSTGRLFSAQKQQSGVPYPTLILGITRSRKELYDRIDSRIESMIEGGLIEEVKALLEKGYLPELPPLSAIGYRQIIQYLQGEISLDEAIIQMKRYTRQYVRRQANWFRLTDSNIHWFEAGPDTVDDMIKVIQSFL